MNVDQKLRVILGAIDTVDSKERLDPGYREILKSDARTAAAKANARFGDEALEALYQRAISNRYSTAYRG